MRNYRLVVRKHELIEYQQREFYAINHSFYYQDKIYDKHWHNSIEITYVVKGRKIQTSWENGQENKVIADEGTLLLVNSGISHKIEVLNGLEGIVLLIDKRVIREFYSEWNDEHFNLSLNSTIENKIIELMLLLSQAKDQDKKIQQHIYVLQIISLLVENLIDVNDHYRERHDENSELITSIMEYINYNYFKPISLDGIATYTNYNKSYLSALFKKKIGITIFEYLKNIRLEHCLKELKTTDKNIVDIALNNGFANIQSFNKVFKEVYHQTPLQYKKSK